ncbi:hypothetical protein [Dolichospermum circinale]|uniref:hypothetical protein n=1 Tax=Dolichospermum circinale TaxID=109265 RepID=UPI00232C471D|nr:hypothetical protein [Dolichospermum circinale]MDB9448331.1 hypothetical protein [Dolichospermum circinale CS-547]
MKWPQYFPKNCPSEAAQPISGTIYRLVDNNPPTSDDFRSWREQNIDQPCPKNITECQTCGLSVFTSETGVCNARNKIPALRKKQVALGYGNSDLGVMLNTPSRKTGNDHHTWWFPANQEPWKFFEIVNISSPE